MPKIVSWFVSMGGPPCRAECSRAWCKLRSVRVARHCPRDERERRAACGYFTAPVGSVGNGREQWEHPRQFVVARLRAPDPIGFPERRPIGAACGSLMSDRQQKSYWVGRDSARELARNQCFVIVRWGKQVSHPFPHLHHEGGRGKWSAASVFCWRERIKDTRRSRVVARTVRHVLRAGLPRLLHPEAFLLRGDGRGRQDGMR